MLFPEIITGKRNAVKIILRLTDINWRSNIEVIQSTSSQAAAEAGSDHNKSNNTLMTPYLIYAFKLY
jgi:hypothetical protein